MADERQSLFVSDGIQFPRYRGPPQSPAMQIARSVVGSLPPPLLFGAIIGIDSLRRDRPIRLSDARARVTRLRNLRR